MFRATLASARKIAWGTWAMLRCQFRRFSRVSGTPSIVILPAVGSSSPIKRSASVLFPLPVLPIRAILCPRRSEERREGKSVDLGGGRVTKKKEEERID